MYRVGVDIGGTFTDFALFDARGAQDVGAQAADHAARSLRRRSPRASRRCWSARRVAIADVSDVVHGTTLVTNAVIERRGAVTGMLATAGFSDILDMGFERRYDLFDLRIKYPPPLVPRRLRLEVAERVRFDGSVELPLDEAAVQRPPRSSSGSCGVAAVAVCFLHSYANPAHEARAAEILREAAPGPLRLRLGRRVSEHARVRALDDDDRQRLHAADVRPLPRAAGEGPRVARAFAAASTSWPPAAAR